MITNLVVTAYCSCTMCCGKTDGITASGKKVQQGRTAAANAFPFGTRLIIEGVGERVVEDRMAKRYSDRVDIYFADHQTARRFGIGKRNITIIPPPPKKK